MSIYDIAQLSEAGRFRQNYTKIKLNAMWKFKIGKQIHQQFNLESCVILHDVKQNRIYTELDDCLYLFQF